MRKFETSTVLSTPLGKFGCDAKSNEEKILFYHLSKEIGDVARISEEDMQTRRIQDIKAIPEVEIDMNIK